jgi:hypothetical protein
MANANWTPKSTSIITNTQTIVDPKYTTINAANTTGYVPVNASSTDPIVKATQYAVQTNGATTYLYTAPAGGTRQFNSVQQIADGGIPGYNKTTTANLTNSMQSNLSSAAGKSPNTSSINPASQQTLTDLGTAVESSSDTRTSYPKDLRYPRDMKSDQDVIIFNMIQYVPTKANLSNISTANSVLSRSESTNIIGTVTMAIQGPISDMNSVGWNDGNMNAAQAIGAAAALAGIEDGPKGLEAAVGQVSQMVSGQKKTFQAATKAFFAGQAVQNQDLFTRTTGAIANPNLELLFQAPQLREFTFTFLLSPRDEDESIMVKKIIRFFKQGMSVKTASTGVFLKTPNTFKIMYKQKGDSEKGAKFLPKIKECALQSFGVNYTPAQNYSTFNNNSMTAYEFNMTFKELIPIYDKDYKDLDGNTDEYIGY